ncbi:MAG: hypothetical protein FWG13_05725 [Leptospirales bacterium]|nr:hypothetical protein [Leptospirales bacterium]
MKRFTYAVSIITIAVMIGANAVGKKNDFLNSDNISKFAKVLIDMSFGSAYSFSI